ncbi:hypothetical protein LQ953_13400 [Sphingomonas sp. IC-56]|uniref:hypothetical protein n=1 Tax=Sphingomonas sp. IC-56 TaxID=2898529 RepID=UPI001E3F2ABB|nr:hypothetical protein [Sphingomonas sp. IC-56]MCD2325014.1 hypothetical protein [Sphingomonas sp. IC-56]
MSANLLRVITMYCERNGLAESKFGLMAVNDPKLVRDMRRGRELRAATARKVREFMGVAL